MHSRYILTGLLLGIATALSAQFNINQPELHVHVMEPNGHPLEMQAMVTISTMKSQAGTTRATYNAKAIFPNVERGDYVVEVKLAGYKNARQTAIVLGTGPNHCYVIMHREGEEETPNENRPAGPILSGKSRKELDAGLALLKEGKNEEARSHIEYALKHAPGNPDVHFVAAFLALQQDNVAEAQKHLEQAVTLFPAHSRAQLMLGELLLRQGKFDESIAALEKSLKVETGSWRAHWLLAEALLRSKRGDQAVAKTASFHAQRAIDLSKDPKCPALSTRARAEAVLNPAPVPVAATTQDKPVAIPVATPVLEVVSDELPATLLPHWPANVDAAVPPVITDAANACSLPQVLEGAARRIAEFGDALERFAATERVTQDELDATGGAKRSIDHSFNYITTIQRYGDNNIAIGENRDGNPGLVFPGGSLSPATGNGVPGIIFLFHARYAVDYNFSCEGLGSWKGQPAWQVHFEQREDRPARIHEWTMAGGRRYPVGLKGRAWFSTGSFQVLRVETDLLKPLPDIRLNDLHMTIDYAPVSTSDKKHELWLPANAEIYSRLRGRSFRERHFFSNFTLFSVESIEKIH